MSRLTFDYGKLDGRRLRASFLESFPGIGPVRAAKLLDRFGTGLPEILASEELVLQELIPALDETRGVVATRIGYAMHARWPHEAAGYAAHEWLEGHGIHEVGLARKIVGICGPKAIEILADNPYVLAKTVPWLKLDKLGLQVLTTRMPLAEARASPERLQGCVDRFMSNCTQRGHTAVGGIELRKGLASLLCVHPQSELVERAVRFAVHRRRLIMCGELFRSPGFAWMEGKIAVRISRWSTEGAILRSAIDRALADVERTMPHSLHSEQRQAVIATLSRRFSLMCGGAGTGKTSTIRAIANTWTELGGRVLLATLSGKAALRLGQATSRLARTIHRLLRELDERDERIEEGKAAPEGLSLLDATTLLVIDEASMVDVGQWMQITDRVEASGARLLITGDVAQLPPIGPGTIFHTLAQEKSRVAQLKTIHRQTGKSGIPEVSLAIRKRIEPALKKYSGAADGVSHIGCGLLDIDREVSRVVAELGGFTSDRHDLLVIAALNRTVDRLNSHFHDRHKARKPEVKGHLGSWFCVGDPVVHLENDYQKALFNGMLGHVVEADVERRGLTVRFEERLVSFDAKATVRLALAYALTCHKLQGSQAERVVIVVEPSTLLDPTWLYTAITRAEKQAVLVGPPEALADALRRPPAFRGRVTAFAHDLSRTSSMDK